MKSKERYFCVETNQKNIVMTYELTNKQDLRNSKKNI